MADADPLARHHRRHFRAEFFAGVLGAAEVAPTPAVNVSRSIRAGWPVAWPSSCKRSGNSRSRSQLLTLGQRHLVGLQVVTGPVAAHVGDVNPALLDYPLGRLVGLPLGRVLAVVALPFQRQAVGLFDVKDGVAADHRRAGVFLLGLALGRAGRLVGRAGLGLLPLVVKLVKEHVGGLLALANLPAHVLDLLVGGPAVIAVALGGLGHAEVDGIPAPVRLVGLDVLGESALAGLPRFLPRRDASRDLRFERGGKVCVIVVLVPACGLSAAGCDFLRPHTITQLLLWRAARPATAW